ncbi:MAG: RraA family protein [Verrucomicrobia bacterium]|nr:RraA family protein [Verrucomicrobiota bacterium]
MNKASFIIRENWPRPDPSLIELFREVPTALVADALGHGFGVLDHDIRPVWNGPNFVGTALPVQTAPHDILAVHVAVKYSRPGDVIVISTGRSMTAAVLGGVTTVLLRNAGIIAAVTDGVVRDLSDIELNGLPVYAAGVSPGIPFKNGPGRIGLAVSLGRVAIEPGDIVIGDQDGVVVVPLCHADHTVKAIENAKRVESNLGAVLTSGVKVPPYVEKALAESHITYVR